MAGAFWFYADPAFVSRCRSDTAANGAPGEEGQYGVHSRGLGLMSAQVLA
jgi:hypothetical protein